jgi:GT2 family glycosyltransferase
MLPSPFVIPPRAGHSSLPAKVDAWSLIVAVNNERVLQQTLLASPAIDETCQVITKQGYSCAGKAYNAGIEEARHDLLVFAHQDVYLPHNWISNLECALTQLASDDPNWAVLGAFGVAKGHAAELRGYCYSTGLRRVLGAPFPKPIAAQSLDELVLVVRRSSGLRFDEDLPGFHLYGTDVCLQAERQGMGSYIVSAFCIHNANGIRYLPADFWRAYFYLRRKWWEALPVTTCCTTLTKWCVPVAHRLALELKRRLRPVQVGTRCDDVDRLYQLISQTSRG